MDQSLSYLRVHSLAHRCLASIFLTNERRQFALDALLIMDDNQVLHPMYLQIYGVFQNNSPENDPLVPKYGPEWAAAIKDRLIASQLDTVDEMDVQAEKPTVLQQFVQRYKILFISGDFQDLLYYVNKISLLVEFRANCTDHEQFIENRYFEFLFHHVATIVYGLLWFSKYSVLEEVAKITTGASGMKSWQLLVKVAWAYHNKTRFLIQSVSDKHKEIVDGVNEEMTYFGLIRWLCAFAKFKENRVIDFTTDFESMDDQLPLLDIIHMRTEALLLYQTATIATKPFCDLLSCKSESLLDLYSGTSSVELTMYLYLCNLSESDFTGAKHLFDTSFKELLDGHIAFAIPSKLAGCFWRYIGVIVDMKVFLLIMSCASQILRSKLLNKMGHKNASEKVRDEVSACIVVLIAGLGLGRVNITYRQADDEFFRGAISDGQRLDQLTEDLDELDHTIEAETVAQLFRTKLVEKLLS